MPESYPFPALHARIAQLAAEGREAEREAEAEGEEVPAWIDRQHYMEEMTRP